MAQCTTNVAGIQICVIDMAYLGQIRHHRHYQEFIKYLMNSWHYLICAAKERFALKPSDCYGLKSCREIVVPWLGLYFVG